MAARGVQWHARTRWPPVVISGQLAYRPVALEHPGPDAGRRAPSVPGRSWLPLGCLAAVAEGRLEVLVQGWSLVGFWPRFARAF